MWLILCSLEGVAFAFSCSCFFLGILLVLFLPGLHSNEQMIERDIFRYVRVICNINTQHVCIWDWICIETYISVLIVWCV